MVADSRDSLLFDCNVVWLICVALLMLICVVLLMLRRMSMPGGLCPPPPPPPPPLPPSSRPALPPPPFALATPTWLFPPPCLLPMERIDSSDQSLFASTLFRIDRRPLLYAPRNEPARNLTVPRALLSELWTLPLSSRWLSRPAPTGLSECRPRPVSALPGCKIGLTSIAALPAPSGLPAS